MAYVIADELLMKNGEESRFDFCISKEKPYGAGLAVSRLSMNDFVAETRNLDFRVTIAGPGVIHVWVNKEEYFSLSEAAAEVKKKKTFREFFRSILPKLTLFWVFVSIAYSIVNASQVSVQGSFYENLGAVSFWVAFGKTFVLCWAVYAFSVFVFIFNGGKAPGQQ